jgi:hypothetical protein
MCAAADATAAEALGMAFMNLLIKQHNNTWRGKARHGGRHVARQSKARQSTAKPIPSE